MFLFPKDIDNFYFIVYNNYRKKEREVNKMFVQVVENNTNKILAQVNTNNWAKAQIHYIEGYRRTFTNARVEWYYGENACGTPEATYKTFH